MSAELTKESRHVLKRIYDIYCERRKAGSSKSSAIYFDSPETEIDGFSDSKRELSQTGFIKSDIVGGCELQDKAIIFMENFTKDSILKWLEVGSMFIP